MKLYGTLTSPFVRKVRVLMHEKQIPYEFVVCDVLGPDSIVPGLNPLGKVPVLALDDGEILFDSALVMSWLDSHFGEPIMPSGQDEYWRAMRWHTLGNGLLDALSERIVEGRRPPEKQWDSARERAEGRLRRGLDLAETTRKDGEFLVGRTLTFGDIALGVALLQIDARYKHDWRGTRPTLDAWHARIAKRQSFVDTMPPPPAA